MSWEIVYGEKRKNSRVLIDELAVVVLPWSSAGLFQS
jgi:hypothetical protein